ncbi:MAG: 7-cyano-7-deazaguanine synthase QueC [Akkermansia sp.]|nr:7-cyano-7-deazaguanine synthase QueC [Akkermansia sp.]
MKVAVLLSGGLDSTTALHWAHRHHEVVCALSFDYGSNHAARELACARWQAESLGVPYHEINLRSISAHLESALLQGADAIPTADYAEENLKQTVVPFRNGIFLAIAAGIAESKGAEGLVIAAHSGDHAIYPDCQEEFMAAMSAAISHGTYAHLQILRPFISSTKAEITATGAAFGVDFSHTYSCYCGREIHCGQCSTCRERRAAFTATGIPDPTEYED